MGEAKHVYQAIVNITAAMAREGIAKGRKNEAQGYRFRSVDDVYAAIGGHLAEQKLCMLPRVVDISRVERTTAKGGISTYTTLTVDFDLISAVDGSTHTIRTVGEAMDSADKSSNKSMSAAFKYACFLAFQIPTEGDNDADAHHPEKAAPSLEKQLAESIDFVEWKKLAHARLLSAASMGELVEAWARTAEEAKQKQIPPSLMKDLSAVKDEMKAKLMVPKNGTPQTAA